MSGFLPLEKVYSYDPAPADMPGREYVLGVQANLWTEYISTAEQAEYMLYPRLFALAEVAWCQPEGKDYGAFRERRSALPNWPAVGATTPSTWPARWASVPSRSNRLNIWPWGAR